MAKACPLCGKFFETGGGCTCDKPSKAAVCLWVSKSLFVIWFKAGLFWWVGLLRSMGPCRG